MNADMESIHIIQDQIDLTVRKKSNQNTIPLLTPALIWGSRASWRMIMMDSLGEFAGDRDGMPVYDGSGDERDESFQIVARPADKQPPRE
ncbi:hypothetical protein FQN51_004545 [Onygenales sp. PD_10]|nr:hypothetical protein FQN51_004545 [Onygenales sp. PD_10]